MFETAFHLALSAMNNSPAVTEKLWQEIQKAYEQSSRHYHNLAHLDNLYLELRNVQTEIKDWTTIIFAIAYHDIVYNTLKQDNEERSAALAYERMTMLQLPAFQKEKCKDLILATKNHSANTDSDTNYFTDADLSILGSEAGVYQNYTKQIRREYRFYPDIIYYPGRKKVLQHFLGMSSIYKTIFFSAKYETQARKNIKEELKLMA